MVAGPSDKMSSGSTGSPWGALDNSLQASSSASPDSNFLNTEFFYQVFSWHDIVRLNCELSPFYDKGLERIIVPVDVNLNQESREIVKKFNEVIPELKAYRGDFDGLLHPSMSFRKMHRLIDESNYLRDLIFEIENNDSLNMLRQELEFKGKKWPDVMRERVKIYRTIADWVERHVRFQTDKSVVINIISSLIRYRYLKIDWRMHLDLLFASCPPATHDELSVLKNVVVELPLFFLSCKEIAKYLFDLVEDWNLTPEKVHDVIVELIDHPKMDSGVLYTHFQERFQALSREAINEVVETIRQYKLLHSHQRNGSALHAVLDKLVTSRKKIAHDCYHHAFRENGFGVLRDIGYMTTPLNVSHAYRPYAEKAYHALEKMPKPFDIEELRETSWGSPVDTLLQDQEHSLHEIYKIGVVTGVIAEKVIPLTAILSVKKNVPASYNLFGASWDSSSHIPVAYLHHTQPKYFCEIIGFLSQMFDAFILDDFQEGELMEKLGMFHWWLAHATFYHRGSAHISKSLVEAILNSKGYHVVWAKHADLEALVTPMVEDYIKNYGEVCKIYRGGEIVDAIAAPPP